MVVLLHNNGGLRTCSLAPLPPPRSLSEHTAAAQAAAQCKYESLALPEVALPPPDQSHTGEHRLWGLGEALQPRPVWEQLPRVEPLQELGPPGPYVQLQLLRLPLQERKSAALPAELLHSYRTLNIDAWAARNKGIRASLNVPLLLHPPQPLGQVKGLYQQLQLALDLGPADVPSIPAPAFTAPDLGPCYVGVPQPAAPAWSFLKHLLTADPSKPCRAGAGMLLPIPMVFRHPSEDGSCGGSLQQEMLQLLDDLSEDCALELAALAAPIPSLRSVQFSSQKPELQLLPKPVPLPPAPCQPKLPTFLAKLCSEPSAAAAKHPLCELPTLEAPILLTSSLASGLAGAGACCLAELFEGALPEPPPGAGWLPPLSTDAKAPTMAMLIAQDMELDDGKFMLPAVVLESCADDSSADSGAPRRLTHQLQAECGIKPASTAHVALYLDWSLSSSNPSLRPPQLAAAARKLRELVEPKPLPSPAVPSPAEARAAVLPQLLSCYKAYHPRSTLWQLRKVEMGSSAGAALMRPGAAQVVAAVARQEKRGADITNQAAAGAAPTAAPGNQPPAALSLPPGHSDFQYFLQMRDAGRQQQAAKAAMHEAAQSDDSAAEHIEEFLGSAACSVTRVALPETHLQLLRFLREDEQQLVKATPGVSKEVANSGFLTVDILQAALQEAAANPRQKGVVRAYAAMAVIRQTALSLVHHGVRCAHLYLSQSAADLPGLLNGVTAARDLHQAYLQVESNKLEDHPKQTALRRALCGMGTLSPGCNVLVVADSKSFFTIYQSIQAASFRVCQLDKDERLLDGGSASAVEAALQQALATANCILASVQLAASGMLPSRPFQHVVQYTSEPVAQAALGPFLASCSCPQHVMQVTADETSAGTAQPAGIAPPLQQQAGGARTTAQGSAAGAGARSSLPEHEWPVVISNDSGRPIRQQRDLYEAILQLEREGASVVERPLALIDAVLSPSAALIIFDNSLQCLEFATCLEHLQPVLERVSYAFSKVILICQGNSAFQAQVLCGMGQVLAVGQSYGLRLQVFPSTSTAATGVLVRDTAKAFLSQWASMDPKLLYSIPDLPTQAEQFLTRFPSLNPHSAMLLASQGASLQQLLHLDLSCQDQLPQALSLIPRHSLELFVQCASHASPVLGMGWEAMGESIRPPAGEYGMVTPASAAPLELSGPVEDGYLSPQGSMHHHRQQLLCQQYQRYPNHQQQQQLATYGDPYMQHGLAKRARMSSGPAGMPLYEPGLALNAPQEAHQQHGIRIPSIAAQPQQPGQHPYALPTAVGQHPMLPQRLAWARGMEVQQTQPGATYGYAGRQQQAYPPSGPHHELPQQEQPLAGQVYSYGSAAAAQQSRMPEPGSRLPIMPQLDLAPELSYQQQTLPQLSGSRGAGTAGYLSSQLMHQQGAQQWDPRYEPQFAMNDMVYQRSMQMMQSRLANGRAAGAQQAQDDLPDFELGLPELDTAPASGLPAGRLGQAASWQQHQQQLSMMPPHIQHPPQMAARQQGVQQQRQAQRDWGLMPQAQPTTAHQQQQPRAMTQLQARQQQAAFSQHPPLAHALHGRQLGVQQMAGTPRQWPFGPQQQLGHVDEFGVSLEPSMSDEESDHDATMSARLSPFGFGQQQQVPIMGNQHTQDDPISSLLGSRRGFAPPRLTAVGLPAEAGGSQGVDAAAADGLPLAKRPRGPQTTFTRRLPGQQASQPHTAQKKKYGKGYRGSAQFKAGGGGGKRGGGSFSRRGAFGSR